MSSDRVEAILNQLWRRTTPSPSLIARIAPLRRSRAACACAAARLAQAKKHFASSWLR